MLGEKIMKYTVVVFASRSDTMRFYKIIKNYGLFCSVINTPRSLSSSCGVSVKIDRRLLVYSSSIIKQSNLYSFKGIFDVELINGKETVIRLM